MGMIDQHLGNQIQHARLAHGVSKADAAASLRLSVAEYTQLERGVERIRASDVSRLAHLFGVSVGWFYEGLPGQAMFGKRAVR